MLEGKDGDALDALLAALEAIVDGGRFERRLPVSERGDVWDGIHATINVLLDILVAKLEAAEEAARRARLAEDRMQDRTRRLETLLEALPVGVLIESADQRIERVNGALLGMLSGGTPAPRPIELTRASFLSKIAGVFTDGAAFRREIERWALVASPAAGTFATRDGRAIRIVYGPIGDAAVGGHLWLYEDATTERREEQLRRGFLAGIVAAQEKERRRVAQELHDQTGQSLTALLVGLQTLAEATPDPASRARAAALRALAEQALLETGRLARGLYPAALADLGLAAALERLARDLDEHYGIRAEVEIRGPLDGLPRATAMTIYRVVQEAVTNVARHSGARSASIVLVRDAGRVRVLVEDDGTGFDAEARGSVGLGLRGMRERAAALEGELTIDSSPGEGTTVALDVRAALGEPA